MPGGCKADAEIAAWWSAFPGLPSWCPLPIYQDWVIVLEAKGHVLLLTRFFHQPRILFLYLTTKVFRAYPHRRLFQNRLEIFVRLRQPAFHIVPTGIFLAPFLPTHRRQHRTIRYPWPPLALPDITPITIPTITAEKISFSRLPNLVLPDTAIARDTVAKMKQLLAMA